MQLKTRIYSAKYTRFRYFEQLFSTQLKHFKLFWSKYSLIRLFSKYFNEDSIVIRVYESSNCAIGIFSSNSNVICSIRINRCKNIQIYLKQDIVMYCYSMKYEESIKFTNINIFTLYVQFK